MKRRSNKNLKEKKEINSMKEYKIIYRIGGSYSVIDKIFDEDSAYMVLTMVIKAGYEDSRIEVEEEGE